MSLREASFFVIARSEATKQSLFKPSFPTFFPLEGEDQGEGEFPIFLPLEREDQGGDEFLFSLSP